MGPDLEKSKAGNGVLASKDNGSVSQVPEDKLVKCVSSYEDKNFHVEALNNYDLDKPSEDMEINILECSNPIDDGQLEARYDDATESMSSFGDTLSDTENYPVLGDEVESHLAVGDAAASVFDGYEGAFLLRKKKLTDHWRRFIRPLMWRCKWIELQLKEFQSQALKYDRELAKHTQRKHFDFDSFVIEGFDTKSLPFSSCTRRKKVMKRKKRKRLEETTDIKSYMLQHNLFSYYENRKSTANGASMNDDFRNNPDKAISANAEFGLQEEWASLDTKGEDNVCENILLKIDALQLQVRKLKVRIEKVVSENPEKFASVNRLISPAACDALTNSDQNNASPHENEDRMPVRSQFNVSHHLHETAVSSDVEVTPHLDLMCENTEEGALIHNEAVTEEEMQDEENFGNQHQVQTEEQAVQVPEGTNVSRSNFGGKTLPKSRSNPPNNKRRSGRRRSGRGGWNRKF